MSFFLFLGRINSAHLKENTVASFSIMLLVLLVNFVNRQSLILVILTILSRCVPWDIRDKEMIFVRRVVSENLALTWFQCLVASSAHHRMICLTFHVLPHSSKCIFDSGQTKP
jgi:hypothetical protein